MTKPTEQSTGSGHGVQADTSKKSAAESVLKWVKSEGFPTEYKTANSFRKNGCRVFQGGYVEDQEEHKMREVDVLAWQDVTYQSRSLLRVSHVVECKWSGDKPWVVFTSPSPISSAACITQTYGSDLGEALLWSVAGERDLHGMRLFATPDEAGFSGRQAFSSTGTDHFHHALRGVTGNALSYLTSYSRPSKKDAFPSIGVLAFPIVVVDGLLFKAFFDDDLQDVRVEEVDDLRCHWRGAKNWRLNSTVDIVTMKSLDTFVNIRTAECRQLLEVLVPFAEKVEQCWNMGSLGPLEIAAVSRGVVGLPKLLQLAIKRGAGSA